MTEQLTNEADCVAFQSKLGLIGNVIMELPLEEYLEKAERATTLGPILDPTLYMKGAPSMDEWVDVARAMKECKDKLLKIREKAKKERGL